MEQRMESVPQNPMATLFKQCYRCRVIYGSEEVASPSGGISHGLCGLCVPKETERLGLHSETQSCFPLGRP